MIPVAINIVEALRAVGWEELGDSLLNAVNNDPSLMTQVEIDPGLPELEARVSALEAASSGEPLFDPRTYGAVCDGVTDDTAAWQALLDDALGSVYLQEGGRIFVPGPSVVSDTIEFRKYTGELFGHGNGRGGGAFIWDGPADIPVLRFRECQGFWAHDFRVTGASDESQKPSALIEMHNWQGYPDPGGSQDAWPNAVNTLQRLWLGRHAHEGGRDEITHHGIHFTGTNTNNDHNTIIDCKILHGTGSAIKIDGSQNVLNKIIGGIYAGFESMLETNATTVVEHPSITRMRDADFIMHQGQKLLIRQYHSEWSAQFVRMVDGGHLIIDQGTLHAFTAEGHPDRLWSGLGIEATSGHHASVLMRNVLFAISTLTPTEMAALVWVDFGGVGNKRLQMDGCTANYGANALDESHFNLELSGDGYRLVDGWFWGRPNSFRNVLDNAGDTLSFARFDGSS